MTQAEKIVAGDRKPTPQIEAAMEDVLAAAKRSADGIREAMKFGELRDRVHLDHVQSLAREGDEQAQKVVEGYATGKLNARQLSEHTPLTREQANARAQEVGADWLESSTYAYRFEVLDDDSVVAVYVTKAGGQPKLKAFEDLDSTRGWHPLRNPDGLV